MVAGGTFLEKSASRMERNKLHISEEKCNPYRKLVGSCIFLEKSATGIEKIVHSCKFP
jgi:hypothetical protein